MDSVWPNRDRDSIAREIRCVEDCNGPVYYDMWNLSAHEHYSDFLFDLQTTNNYFPIYFNK